MVDAIHAGTIITTMTNIATLVHTDPGFLSRYYDDYY